MTQELQIVSSVTGIPEEAIMGSSRKAEIVEARHLFFYVLRKDLILEEIAKMTGRNHSTVIHGVRRINDYLSIKDERITTLVNNLDNMNVLSL